MKWFNMRQKEDSGLTHPHAEDGIRPVACADEAQCLTFMQGTLCW